LGVSKEVWQHVQSTDILIHTPTFTIKYWEEQYTRWLLHITLPTHTDLPTPVNAQPNDQPTTKKKKRSKTVKSYSALSSKKRIIWDHLLTTFLSPCITIYEWEVCNNIKPKT
jgi:hypothetical protein